MRKRVAIIAVNVAIVLSIVGGTAAYATLNKTVTLSVDGKEKSVRTFGSKVSDVLEAEHIKVGEHDVVAPDADASIEDGSRVAVRYGRQLTVTVDGEKRSYWVTADNVADALDQLGLRVDEAKLSTSRSSSVPRDGLALTIVRPKTVKIEADGDQRKVKTTGATVGDVLDEAGIKLDHDDEVRPKASKKVDDGMSVDVTRVKAVKRTETVAIDYDVDVRNSSSMYTGDTKVVREGKDGKKKVTVKVIKADGKVRSRKVIGSQVVAEPRSRIEKHGTKEEAARTSGGSSSGGGSGVWDRLAQCESGGDWHINTGNGYYGGLQFNAGTWHSYGGSGLPSEHSRGEQIAIAEKVRDASGGYGAWPACSSSLGLPQ
ncbi:MAG: ubiquitin-like domain-containing protein [Nocardioidaceae bacterium]